jgi:hypothetical protein
MATKKKLLQAAAGTAAAGGGAGGLNVEDVFSTYLYEGNGSTQTITNGIDLDAEGGLVWVKQRSSTNSNTLHDTERGANSALFSNNTSAENTQTNRLTAFNSDGFTLGDNGGENTSGEDYASWTFRKAPKFFDVVEFTNTTGNDVDISHNLGAVPAMIIGKRTDASDNWMVWHVGTGMSNGGFTGLSLNNTASAFFTSVQSDQGINSTTFNTGYVLSHDGSGNYTKANVNGASYVFYLFAHNDGDGEFGPDGDADIIKCDSYTCAPTGIVDLGFEPQWIMIKRASGTGDWVMFDAMRGLVVEGNDAYVYANTNGAEVSNTRLNITPTGFSTDTTDSRISSNGETYIYIAIRRGPMAVPESATDVFDVQTYTEILTSGTTITSGFVTDAVLQTRYSAALGSYMTPRLTNGFIPTHDTVAEVANDLFWDRQDGVGVDAYFNNTGNATDVVHMWKRAPNYFDVVAYTGNGTAGRTVSHNLGVAPEMIWVKQRNAAAVWTVYHSGIGETKHIYLSDASGAVTQTNVWNDTAPTDTAFTTGTYFAVNDNNDTYIAYLFASLDGVSKLGTFTTTSGALDVDCGFSSGARFVLLKKTNAAEDWFLFDSERGIVSGNDPYLYLNDTNAEATSSDPIDPLSSGFTVNGSFWGSGNTYIFYAIA